MSAHRHETGPAPGFDLIERLSPFNELTGPIYLRRDGVHRVIGLRVLEKHCNLRSIMHGGMLATLSDIAIGHTLAHLSDPPRGRVTASLTVNFAGSAKVGDWLEAHVDVHKHGGRLSFASCNIHCGDQRIGYATAVFATASERRADT